MSRTWVRWACIFGAALPAVLPLWLILRYGVDLPYWDQWEGNLAGLYVKAAEGTLSFWDFTAPHNEHRMFVPRTLMFVLNLMTKWNTVGEMLLSWVIVCITSFCVLWLIRQTVGGGALDGRGCLLWFLSNLMLFTVMQQENWLWGIGIMNVLPPMFIVAAMAVLYTAWSRPVRVGASMLMCAGAMFSSGQGILAFPLVGVLVAWSNTWKQLKAKQMVLLAWAGGFALCMVMFVYGYKLPKLAEGLENKVVTFWERVVYFMTFIGNQFFFVRSMHWQTTTLIGGTISLSLFLLAVGYFLYLVLRQKDTRGVAMMLPWVLIGAYALLSVCIAAIFRTNVGLDNAISSRYVTVTLYLHVGLICLVPMICLDLRSRFPIVRFQNIALDMDPVWIRIPAILATVLVMAWLVVLPSAWYAGILSSVGRRQAKAALLLINVLPETRTLARHVFPRVDELKTLANRLDQLGYLRPRLINSSFVNQLRDPRYENRDLSRFGAFERMIETSPSQILASGWAINPDRFSPADAIILAATDEMGQEKVFIHSSGVTLRPDLSKAFADERYELTGWSISYGTSLSPEQLDTVAFSAWVLDADTGKLRSLPGRPTITRGQQRTANR